MTREDAQKVADIVRDAGGEIVGRTRLQKIAYLLTITGLEDGFSFKYKHFGPYSEELAKAAHYAHLLDLLDETENLASWGGLYSIYTNYEKNALDDRLERLNLAKKAAKANAIELELVATALFLAKEGHDNPWVETKRRKPQKSNRGRLSKAKKLYGKFRNIKTPHAWPVMDG